MTEFKHKFVSKRNPPVQEARELHFVPPAMRAYYAARIAGAKEKRFIPSPEQRAYFDWLKTGSGSVLIEAVAGSGKTTTLVQGLPFMTGNIFFGAFGKDAATDIQRKARDAKVGRTGIHMSTMHSAGFSAIRYLFPRVAVDDRKVSLLIQNYARGHEKQELIERSSRFIARMVSFGKQYLFGCAGYPNIDDDAEWLKLCDHFSADSDLPDNIKLGDVLPWVMHIYQKSHNQCESLIDYDDMIYAPIACECRFFQNDWIIGDEWQDANPARREIAKRLLKPGGRAVFVGDNRQSIFGFTGASHDSLEVTAAAFSCSRLSLSVSYRCAKSIVSYVTDAIDPTYPMRAQDGADDGRVRSVDYKQKLDCPECEGDGHHILMSEFPVPCRTCKGARQITQSWFLQDSPAIADAILCRYTKPLILTAYAMIRDGIACRVEGRDIGKNLIALAHMWRITQVRVLKERLITYLKREVDKARQQNSERREQEVTDRVETLRVFIERCEKLGKTRINELVEEIEALFADNVTDMVRLSTGHKAKGREWRRVYWLRTPARQQKKEWETISERNIELVIATRAMHELIMVPEQVHSPAKEKSDSK